MIEDKVFHPTGAHNHIDIIGAGGQSKTKPLSFLLV